MVSESQLTKVEEQLAEIDEVDLVSRGTEDQVKRWASMSNIPQYIDTDLDQTLVLDHHPTDSKHIQKYIQNKFDYLTVEYRGDMRSVISIDA